MSELDIQKNDLNVGDEVYLRWIVLNEDVIGALFIHKPRNSNELCFGHINFNNHPDATVKWGFNFDLQHPSITPSILCMTCGRHGYITDGKWQEC